MGEWHIILIPFLVFHDPSTHSIKTFIHYLNYINVRDCIASWLYRHLYEFKLHLIWIGSRFSLDSPPYATPEGANMAVDFLQVGPWPLILGQIQRWGGSHPARSHSQGVSKLPDWPPHTHTQTHTGVRSQPAFSLAITSRWTHGPPLIA